MDGAKSGTNQVLRNKVERRRVRADALLDQSGERDSVRTKRKMDVCNLEDV